MQGTATHEARRGDEIRRVAMASFVGSAMEWYDYFIYATASALVFGRLFFPEFSPLAGTLASFATFAVGFFARPVGGVFFGHFGDKIGRKAMLVVTLLCMGIATFLIGLLPTFNSIGVLAPILLVSFRFIQGFSVGGEWGGAMLMVVEHAPEERLNFYASMPQLGSPVALIVSASIFTGLSYLPDEQFFAWGWRLPFLLSIILVGVGLFIRLRVAESPAFERVKETRTEASAPFLDTLRRYPTASLLASGLSIGILGSFYIVVTFTLAYATEQLGISRNISLIGLLAVGFVLLAFVPVFSALADRLGRRSILIASAAFLTLYAFPFFWLVDTGSTALVLLAMVVYGVAVAPLSGTSGALLSELFETRVRYTGISFGYQMGSVLGGAIAPFVSTALIAWSGGASWPVAIYLLVLCTICLICVLLASDKYRVRIFEEQPATPRGQGVAGEQRPMRAD